MKVESMGNKVEVYKKKYFQKQGVLPRTWWDKPEYSARDNGTRELSNLFSGQKNFDFPKALNAVKDALLVGAFDNSETALDFFAGSGTSGHATINLNREDGGNRKYILVEILAHFDKNVFTIATTHPEGYLFPRLERRQTGVTRR